MSGPPKFQSFISIGLIWIRHGFYRAVKPSSATLYGSLLELSDEVGGKGTRDVTPWDYKVQGLDWRVAFDGQRQEKSRKSNSKDAYDAKESTTWKSYRKTQYQQTELLKINWEINLTILRRNIKTKGTTTDLHDWPGDHTPNEISKLTASFTKRPSHTLCFISMIVCTFLDRTPMMDRWAGDSSTSSGSQIRVRFHRRSAASLQLAYGVKSYCIRSGESKTFMITVLA